MITKTIPVKDEKGNERSIQIHQQLRSQATKDNPSAKRPGLKEAFTDKGQRCTPYGKEGQFKIVETGEFLTPI